jgi:chromosomal replication initiator protein
VTVLFRALLSEVATRYGIDAADILGKDRHKTVARARHIAIYVARERWDWSYPELGRRFGNRDHTSCMHACRRMARERGDGTETGRFVDSLLRHEAFGEHLAKVPGVGLELREAI